MRAGAAAWIALAAAFAVAAALCWSAAPAALDWRPALTSYGGLSGVLHAGVAVVAWQLLRRDHGTRRSIGAAVLVGLVVKLFLERPWESPTRSMPGWDFAVAPLAHATGSAAGLACALVADLVAARMGRRP